MCGINPLAQALLMDGSHSLRHAHHPSILRALSVIVLSIIPECNRNFQNRGFRIQYF